MTVIEIHYQAAPNRRINPDGTPCGWLPVVWDNGHLCASTWASCGYGLEEARALARARAEEIGARFIGDWDVQLIAGAP